MYKFQINTELEPIDSIFNELCITLHQNWFGYSIFNHEKEAFVVFETELTEQSHPELNEVKVKDWLSKNQEIFNKQYKKINIAVSTDHFIILPNEDIDILPVFELLNPFNADKEIILSSMVHSDFYIHFSLKKSLWHILINFFEQKEIFFGDFGFIKEAKNLPNDNEFLMAQVIGNDLSICFAKDGKPQFFNKFKFETKEDLLYYVVLAYEELGLDRNGIPLLLYGFIERDSPLFQTLFGFVRHIRLAPATQKQKNSPLLNELPAHYFHNLLNLIK